MNNSFDLECLRSFITVAQLGSFTRTADALNRTQAAVSQHIRKLEQQLGRRLFDRHSRAVTLTSDGQVLLGYARRMLALQEEIFVAFDQAEEKKVVRFGTPDDYATSFLPAIIASYGQTHPNVEIEVRCNLSIELIESLNKREIDLALVTRQAGSTAGDDVRHEPLVWVGAPGGMAYQREVLPLALFSSHDKNCMFRKGSVRLLEEVGREYKVAYASRSTAVLLSAVRADLAVAVLARSSAPPDLVILDENDGLPPLPEIRLAVQRRSGRRDPAVDALADHVIRVLSFDNTPGG